jgi:predicted nucleic acid-binding protein
MAYADTSVLLALFLNEPKTPDAWRWVNQQPAGSILASDWTLTECSSALAVKLRMKAIDADTHGKPLPP